MNIQFQRRSGAKFLFIPFGIVAFITVFSFAVMFLWNNTIAVITETVQITFWQAMGILVLTKILFGFGHGKNPFNRNNWREKKYFADKIRNMSPEERLKFKEEMKMRCGDKKGFWDHAESNHENLYRQE